MELQATTRNCKKRSYNQGNYKTLRKPQENTRNNKKLQQATRHCKKLHGHCKELQETVQTGSNCLEPHEAARNCRRCAN
eukprot:10260085-Alexandrium_andersonii.AAC.1